MFDRAPDQRNVHTRGSIGPAMASRTAGTDVRVRPARPDDADRLTRWVAAVAWESEGVRVDEGTVAKGVQQAIADPAHRQYFILEQDGQCVGGCLVTTEWSDWTASWYAWLQSIYIEDAHRGREGGLLEALLDHVHEESGKEGTRLVRLYVDAGNARAVKAYERCGYEKTSYLIYEKPARA